jgi:hypothetical protein
MGISVNQESLSPQAREALKEAHRVELLKKLKKCTTSEEVRNIMKELKGEQ